MNPERERLMRDLWGDDEAMARREATLRAGQRAMRFRRFRRNIVRTSAVVVILTGLGFGLLRLEENKPGRMVSAPSAPGWPQATRYLTDDELLALFPNTPVGLAKVGSREVLVFPRAEDEERFVGRF